jgi:hypothetical protein
MARHVEFLEELLHGGDFIGLLVDLDTPRRVRKQSVSDVVPSSAGLKI